MSHSRSRSSAILELVDVPSQTASLVIVALAIGAMGHAQLHTLLLCSLHGISKKP